MTGGDGSRAAWLALAFGNDRQYAGNTGYDDELTETAPVPAASPG